MYRRSAISLLVGCLPAISARPIRSLERFLPGNRGCALLLDVSDKQTLAVNSNALSDRILLPPGSTLKPLSLLALLRSGKLRADEALVCPQKLILGGRRMDCSHTTLAAPVGIDTALAYSCNCFTARVAGRFTPGELARSLQTADLVPGDIRYANNDDEQRLQALGEADVLVTPLGLARAYRQLALRLNRTSAEPGAREILAGLEDAVKFGTGQLARVAGTELAGKTGSVRNGDEFAAWFAGFVPSRAPKVVITVMVSGKSGGSDAAPVAGRIVEAWRAGLL